MLNEKCSDFSEWDLNYNPTTCGSALFVLFIKHREKMVMQSITKQLPELRLQICRPASKGQLSLPWAPARHPKRGPESPMCSEETPPSFLAGSEGSSPGTTLRPHYVSSSPHFSAFPLSSPPVSSSLQPYLVLYLGAAIWHLVSETSQAT